LDVILSKGPGVGTETTKATAIVGIGENWH